MIHRTLAELPEQGTSHDPAIRKKTMIRKGELGPVCLFAQARFLPGQRVESHRHETMAEVFFVEEGRGVLTVEGRDIALAPGTCVAVEAGESHAVENPGDEVLVLTYFGVES